MSRNREFMYFVGPREEIPESKWDEVFCFTKRCSRKKPIPCKYIGGGGGDEYGWTVWITANRSKARRIRETLDQHFGHTGELLDVTDWDFEDPDALFPWEQRELRYFELGSGAPLTIEEAVAAWKAVRDLDLTPTPLNN